MHIFFAKIMIFFSPQTFLAMKSEKTPAFPTPYALGILGRCLARGTRDLGGVRAAMPPSCGAVRAWRGKFHSIILGLLTLNCSIVQLFNCSIKKRASGEGGAEKTAPICRKDIEIPLYILFTYKNTYLYFIFFIGDGRMSFLQSCGVEGVAPRGGMTRFLIE